MTVLMLTVDGGTLSYNVSGAGPPIVFVAGLGASSANEAAERSETGTQACRQTGVLKL